tara:strand:- start:749 stop:1876 length:1128 start_codon:yes stop_codon:yes gene_type:complete
MSFEYTKILFSILSLNIKIIYLKYKNKKIIFFYSPSKKITNPANYIQDLFSEFEKDFVVIFGFNSENILKNENYYFIKPFFLKFIYNVDIFFDNSVSTVFTNKSIRILMHHDIYHTPLLNSEKEKTIFEKIYNYDFILLSNKKNVFIFKSIFNNHFSNLNKNSPKLVESGYVKLDYLKNLNKINLKNNSIVIAPTNYKILKELSIFYNIEKIIEDLFKYTSSRIIFRPHPANLNDENTLKIRKMFSDNEKFIFDDSKDYFNTYSSSICLITDVSGTAYTYAFLTKKPVIFFSADEKLSSKMIYEKIPYFNDRNKIGVVVNNLKEMQLAITNVNSLNEEKKSSIANLEKEMIYLGNSKKRIKEIIEQIIENKYETV